MTTAEKLVRTLTAKTLTCATAESCTGGGIGRAITDVSGASAVFWGGVISYDNLSVDMSRYELKVKGKVVDTPPKELELLNFLASHPNRVFTRDQLLDEVWGFEYYGDSRTIDVHIKRLREKLEGASDKWRLKTVWSVGYMFEVTD